MEAAKKVLFLVARPLRGGGVSRKGLATKKKELATKLEGKALVAEPLRK